LEGPFWHSPPLPVATGLLGSRKDLVSQEGLQYNKLVYNFISFGNIYIYTCQRPLRKCW